MEILPIKSIDDSDQALVGANIVNLAKLARAEFPVPEGVVVTAPDFILTSVVKLIEGAEKSVFEQRLVLAKNQLLKSPIPVELDNFLDERQIYFLPNLTSLDIASGHVLGITVKKKQLVWENLVNLWLEQINSRFYQRGFDSLSFSQLTPLAVFVLDKVETEILAFFDTNRQEVIAESSVKLQPKVLQEIDQLVNLGNKKIFLPQVYILALANKHLCLLGVLPHSGTLPKKIESHLATYSDQQKPTVKSAAKVFLQIQSGFSIYPGADGIIVQRDLSKHFEETIFRLTEAAITFPEKKILFKLPTSSGDLSGLLSILHQPQILEECADIYQFVRNKKKLLNVEMVLPLARGVSELRQIKQDLLSLGVDRKGSSGLWLEMSIPENIINIEDYLNEGIDGVIIDLDLLQKHLFAYEVDEAQFYQKACQVLIKFVLPAVKSCHQQGVPALISGELALFPDVTENLIKRGVWGVICDNLQTAESLPEWLNLLENNLVLKIT
ncbi:hypothetical protein M1563_03475 [Patescibacteria group bacterium]|nr:hypothetical protein [Patescibacteria group bacterium]MCL5409601.1 hypothetical protein [Patescibacteria group bacterium]